MSEAPKISSEERMEEYKKFAKESVAKSKKRKDEKSLEEMNVVATELRGKLKKRKEEKETEPYESFQISKGAGEGAKSSKKETNKHVISRDIRDMNKAMKEKSVSEVREEISQMGERSSKGKMVTSEQAPVFSGEINVEDHSPIDLPSGLKNLVDKDEEGAPSVMRGVDESKKQNKKAAAKENEENFEAVVASLQEEQRSFESKQQQAKESRSDEARTDYIAAYKKYDPRFTKNKSDDQIAKTKPPFFAFGKAVRELRKLHGIMVRAEDSRVGGLSPEARQDIIESGQFDEEMEVEKMKQDKINK